MQDAEEQEKYERLIDHLCEVRGDQGLSLRDLAKKLGRSHAYVQKIENKTRQLNMIGFVAYCHALEVDPVEVFKLLVE